ncbi:MAG TPA: PLP-dependent aminotransferase family protein [Anaerolineales bacterium]|jgi:GntR family transcriptional regulator/MocR family aminotransferase|nr:PLP-dependent aminotransferase family protein [Anaerolineales bacterium]
MRIPLDRQSAVPLYQQIETYLRHGILSGSLAAETRLPASRQLARDLGVNRITVESAYAGLETDGLIYSKMGSGTYVLPPNPLTAFTKDKPGAAWPLWQQSLESGGETSVRSSDELSRRASRRSQLISFASGIGDAHLFPAEDFRKVLQTVMRRDGIAALDYGEPNGHAPLRETITHILASQGLQTRSEDVLITAGSQQALSLVSQLLLKPGDVIMVESPTYSGALELFRALGFKVVGVPVDRYGMQVEVLEKLLQQHHPKLIYTIPTFHNPTGTCLSSQRRIQLIVLADRYNIPILEDDFVGDLRYEGRAQPALKALDPGGRVIYVSTFSKILMPGLRVGFLVVEGPIYQRLVDFKRVNDLATSTLIQRALEVYVTVGRYQSYLRRSCQLFRKRRDTMLSAIERYLPKETNLDPPQGGLFIWLQLPKDISSEKLLPLAWEEGVEFSPGGGFFSNGLEGENWLRLNFVAQASDQIEEGIRRLGRAMKRLRVAP